MKFKVWDDKLKSFLSSEFYFLDSMGKLHYMDKQTDRLFIIHADTCSDWVIPVRSTETNDKNGIELFDGDLFYSTTNCLVEIVWGEAGWSTKYLSGRGKGAVLIAYDSVLSGVEKIGSKLENPELLKAE